MMEGARQQALEQIALRLVLVPSTARERAFIAFQQYYDDVLQEYGIDSVQRRDWLEVAMADLRALVSTFHAGIEWSAPLVNPGQPELASTREGSQTRFTGALDDASGEGPRCREPSTLSNNAGRPQRTQRNAEPCGDLGRSG